MRCKAGCRHLWQALRPIECALATPPAKMRRPRPLAFLHPVNVLCYKCGGIVQAWLSC